MKRGLVLITAILSICCSTSNIPKKSLETSATQGGSSGIAHLNDSLLIGLVAYYPFNGTANDASGNGFNATVRGGAMLVADRFGNPSEAYEFHGLDEYIDCGDILDEVFCAPVAKFTVSGWGKARATGTSSAGSGFIIGKNGGGGDGPYQWSLSYVDGKIYGQVFFDTLAANYVTHTSPMQTNAWFHYVLVFDGGRSPAQRLSLYVNGQAANANGLQKVGFTGTTTVNSQQHLLIGGTYSANGPRGAGNFFNGDIDDIHIYGRALSSDEIRALYRKDGYNAGNLFVVQPASLIPSRNSVQGLPKSGMSVMFSADFDVSTLTNRTVCVNGSISGRHECAFTKVGESKSVIIAAKTPFRTGEIVTVTLTRGIMSAAGDSLSRSFSWSFTEKTNGGSGLFQVSKSIPMGDGSNPHSGVALDVDGNGTLDLVFANYDLGTLTILRNDSSGALVRTSIVNVGDHPNCIVSADFDGDGTPDLVSTNFGDNTISGTEERWNRKLYVCHGCRRESPDFRGGGGSGWRRLD